MTILGVVIPTKDRPESLRRTIESLERQSARPAQVVVVDASHEPLRPAVSGLTLTHVLHQPPSTTVQRMAGLAELAPEIDLVAFVDDDVTFEEEAFARMASFWRAAAPSVGGAGFNVRPPEGPRPVPRRGALLRALGLYDDRVGRVAPSGWQARMPFVEHDTRVNWLPTGAVVYRRGVLEATSFDPFFEGYGYLEDLDLSYSVSRRHALWVVSGAVAIHHEEEARKADTLGFGRAEVRNRLYFVRKHGLSVQACRLGLLLRCGLSVAEAVRRLDAGPLRRAAGNVLELARRRGLRSQDSSGPGRRRSSGRARWRRA